MFPRRIPLAWHNLTHDRRRLLAAVSGITFAVLLMFLERGFQNALFDSTVEVIRLLDAKIVLVNRAQYALPAQQRFSRLRIDQAKGCPGVASVHPVFIETYYSVLKRPGHKGYPIRVIGLEPGEPIFTSPAINRAAADLKLPESALIDDKSKAKYGFNSTSPRALSAEDAELANRTVRLVGTFELGTDFANDGNLIMSDANFARYFPRRHPGDPLSVVDLGVVQLQPDADVLKVQQTLRAMLPNDVAVYTKQEMIEHERQFWHASTPVGFIFALGTLMGFVVGVVICYQVLYASIADHVDQFATLRAMGYPSRYFIGVVLCEAVYLSLLGFVPGLLLAMGAFYALGEYTGLLLVLTLPRVAFVYFLALVMCTLSGCLAMRKVLAVDPAELF